ncbi:MAG: M1 family metallopeptidase [Gemmatimonadetes bacterium]|nr:M1 family metallopeptidase [Gemmatimonadota bacterium]MYG84405.1 M1 family metallopeptidase [Gemmatimonadota bacterium]MYJ88281.1 M1 family metallopeptidase [Gemmatimonadota bacterium]
MIAFPPRTSSRLLPAFLSSLLFYLFSLASDTPGARAAVTNPQAISGPSTVDRPSIPGPAIEAALEELYRQLDGRRIGESPLEEILDDGGPSLAERYGDARIRLRERHALDSLLARPVVRLNVFFEEEERLSAELWDVRFVQHEDGWKAEQFEPLLAAHLGFRFSLREDEVYAFDRLTIERSAGVFEIEDGLLMPGFSGDRIGRAVLVGPGRFTFTPSDRVERHQMNKYARTTDDAYTTGFDRMVLILSPDGYEHLVEGVALSRIGGGRAFDRAKALLNRVDRDYLLDMKPARERFSLAHTHADFLQAEIDLADSDRWLVYTNSPYEPESVSLVQKSGFPRNPDISPPVVWCRFAPGPPGPEGPEGNSGRDAQDETVRGPLLSLDHYDIAGSLERGGMRLRMKTTVEITARADPLTAATFTLNPDLDVYRVEYDGGDDALFTRQGTWLTVPFRRPVPGDSTTTLTLWYEGDVFRDRGGSVFGLLTNQQWLPVHSSADLYTFVLELHYPEKLTVATVGAQVASHAEEDTRVTRWRRTQPVSSLGMTVSENRTRTVSAGGIDVILSVDEDRRTAEPNTARILTHIGPALDFFGGIFGPYPYEKLDVVQMPDNYAFGRALPSMLMLWGLYFQDAFGLDTNLHAHMYTEVQHLFRGFLAHELAHQWWGGALVPKTYRDAWLSEAMATYAADLYIESETGPEAFREMLKRHTDQALFADRHGAIDLGMRLGEHYQSVVYEKGALVLHMLRRTIGDEHFMNVLSRFCRQYAGKPVTTADFEAAVKTETGREMGWFFDQWIRDTGYPVYRVYFTSSEGGVGAVSGGAVSSGPGQGGLDSGGERTGVGFTVRGQLLQEQEGRVFHAIVPLVIELENGDRIVREIWNTQRRQTFEYALPDRAKRIDIAPDFSVYYKAAR